MFMRQPSKFMKALEVWLKDSFNHKFMSKGNSLARGCQTDSFSCGIIAMNAIEHAVFGKHLWSVQGAVFERINWFVRIVERHCALEEKPVNMRSENLSLWDKDVRTHMYLSKR